MKYFIKTFGCSQNEADSERVAAYYEARGYEAAESIEDADDVIINTCMVRQSAEDRVYGLVNNLRKLKLSAKGRSSFGRKIILTGCMVGMAVREKTGRMLALLKKRMPGVDEFLPIEEVGFDFAPVRTDAHHAWVPIANGCNNFCTFCVVPFTRGREVSRPFEDILTECRELARQYAHITLVGQNVNSYGADLLQTQKVRNLPEGRKVRPTYVKHLGRLRIPTLFPQLLGEVSKIASVELIDFISSNPWDFSDELIETIAKNPKISRHIHLPVQSGDNEVLRRMNRWYTAAQYIALTSKLKSQISSVTISTDIIVGFPGETEEQFQHTVGLAQEVGFSKAYIAMYSDRPMTAAHKTMIDDVPHAEKKRRWQILEELINKPNLKPKNLSR